MNNRTRGTELCEIRSEYQLTSASRQTNCFRSDSLIFVAWKTFWGCIPSSGKAFLESRFSLKRSSVCSDISCPAQWGAKMKFTRGLVHLAQVFISSALLHFCLTFWEDPFEMYWWLKQRPSGSSLSAGKSIFRKQRAGCHGSKAEHPPTRTGRRMSRFDSSIRRFLDCGNVVSVST